MDVNISRHLKERAEAIEAAIERFIPKRFDEEALVYKISPPKYEYNLEALTKAVAEPVWEFLGRGGKRWRPTLFLLICEALGKSAADFLEFAIIPEVVHNGTLIVDDVEDSSKLRRGKPCTYRIYGVDVAVNAGNALYYLALLPLMNDESKISPPKKLELYTIYMQEMINLSLGQATDIAWHRGLVDADQIEEKNYLQMCAYKTGTLARMAAKMAATLADASSEIVSKLGAYAEAIGVAFQMQDDILDLVSEGFSKKKGGRGQDITEGKYSLLVIYTMRKASPEDKARLSEILSMHTSDEKLKDEAISLMKKYGAIEYVKDQARKIVEKSWVEIEAFLQPSDAKEKLKSFATYLIQREF